MDNIAKVIYEYYRIRRKGKRKGPPVKSHLSRVIRGEKDPLLGLNVNIGLSPRGGMTRCIIELVDGHKVMGEALCSMSDNFCYKIGRRIAYGRAIKAIEELR